MQGNTRIFVKVDLLLHEKEFDALRHFAQTIDNSRIDSYSSIDYSEEDNCVIVTSLSEEMLEFPDLHIKMDSGYALMTIDSLKKFIPQ